MSTHSSALWRFVPWLILVMTLLSLAGVAQEPSPKPLSVIHYQDILPGGPDLQPEDSGVCYRLERDKLLADLAGTAQEAKTYLDAQSTGHRAMLTWYIDQMLLQNDNDKVLDASWNPLFPTVRGPWRDFGAEDIKDLFEPFIEEFYRLGGQLDMIVMDYENGMPVSVDSATLAAVQNDPRFMTDIYPLLGFSNLQLVLDTGQPQYRIKWDAMINKRISQYLNYAFLDVARVRYPNVKLSNWEFYDFRPAPLGVPYCEGTRFYEWTDGFHTGTHQSPAAYGFFWPAFSSHPPDGASNPYPFTNFRGILYDVNKFRQCANVPNVPVQPTFCWNGFGGPPFWEGDIFQENFFHIGLTNPSELLFWNATDCFISTDDDDECTAASQVEFYNLLQELNGLVGWDDKTPLTIDTLVPWDATYMMSGMNANRQSVWRFTPNFEALSGETMSTVLAQRSPTKFQVGNKLITFPAGSDIYTPANPALAPAGYWVTAPLSGSPTVTTNVRPTVTLTAPADYTLNYLYGSTITLTASASDSDGAISAVGFYDGETLIYNDTNAPYSYNWTTAPAGSHTITARATDNGGAVTTSNAAHIAVLANGTGLKGDYYNNETLTAPIVLSRTDATVNFSWGGSPGSGVNSDYFSVRWSGYVLPKYSQTYTFYTTANLGSRLWVNGTQLFNRWTGYSGVEVSGTIALTAGVKYPIVLEFHDTTGTASCVLRWSSTSQSKQIIPQSQLFPGNTLPTVSITAPANNTLLQLVANNVTITANAADIDGTVTKVEFYEGANKLGEDTTAPYSYQWNDIPAGTYAVTAKAYDNFDGVTTSAAISLKVNAPPTIDILTAPGYYREGFYIDTYTTEAEVGGKVRKVVFYVDGKKVARSDKNCYPVPNQDDPAGLSHHGNYGIGAGWWCVPGKFDFAPGPHTIRAEATDLDGGVGTDEITFTWVDTAQGLQGEYYGTTTWGDLRDIRTDNTVEFSWGANAPTPNMPVDYFGVRWSGYLLPKPKGSAPYNQQYTFYVQGDDGIRLWVDDQLVIDQWVWAGDETASAPITLNDGQLYKIRMELREDAGWASAFLRWSSPSVAKEIIPATQFYQPFKGLTGQFYDNPDWTDRKLTRIDRDINFQWWGGSPDPLIDQGAGDDDFSIRWNGFIRPRYSETYTFKMHVASGIRLWIGDTLLIDDLDIWGQYQATGTISLQAGKVYPIRVDYRTQWGNAWIFLWWSSATQAEEIVPNDCLFPVTPTTQVSVTSPANNAPCGQSITLTASASDPFVKKVEFYDGANKLGEDTTAPYSYDWSGASLGAHTITAKAIDIYDTVTTSTGVTLNVMAGFVGVDTITQGNWKGVYGADGYNIRGDGVSYPAYATVSIDPNIAYWVWDSDPTATRALQRVDTGRIAACWFHNTGTYVDVDLTDGQTHRVAIYCLDWDPADRAQTVDILDAATDTVLNSQSVDSFNNGKYLVWDIRGHVKIRITKTSGINCVFSGLFFN